MIDFQASIENPILSLVRENQVVQERRVVPGLTGMAVHPLSPCAALWDTFFFP